MCKGKMAELSNLHDQLKMMEEAAETYQKKADQAVEASSELKEQLSKTSEELNKQIDMEKQENATLKVKEIFFYLIFFAQCKCNSGLLCGMVSFSLNLQ